MNKLIIILILITFGLNAQNDKIWLNPNKGQWDEHIDYKVNIQNGEMYVDKTGFTFQFDNRAEFLNHHHRHHETIDSLDKKYIQHVIKTSYIGSNLECVKSEENFSSFYYNYFIGNDNSKWKSEVKSLSKVVYKEFYQDIDYIIESEQAALKYSFILQPNSNVNQIKFKIDGIKNPTIDKEGNLIISHLYGEIKNSKPKAWTIDENGKKVNVKIEFQIKNNIVSFKLPNTYNHSAVLYIDPSITFSSYSGSTSDNWGNTATPDQSGNLYAAGIVFGSGYPVTAGVFDNSFNHPSSGGYENFDVTLSKFNENGTAFLYSTYLGGSNGNEVPLSLVCDDESNLYMLGTTSSSNFPTSGSPYQANFNGGPTELYDDVLTFEGADLFILKLNPTGSSLLSSTFLGGSGNDGINRGNITANDGDLVQNYGDNFRGEIIVDANGDVIIAASSSSSNFPTLSASQATFGGNQDAVFAKLSSNLSSLIWSTYYGGSSFDAGYSVQVNSLNEVYATGGTISNNISFPSGNSTSNNGNVDGFILHFPANSSTILNATFVGTSSYDQTYFVQIDNEDFVYVYGQTSGTMSITTGIYGVSTAGQFIRKYSSNLNTIQWNTKVGGPSGNIHTLSPTAFLVSDCKEIYFAGWGGMIINTNISNFPTTSDAFMTSIAGGDGFYISVLSPNASDLKYATFIGGASQDHVDGGTSRFDKGGRIYHAVCSACGGQSNGFVSTPGVIGTTNNSSNCNLAAFKFELNTIEAIAGSPDFIICIPDPVQFFSNSINGEVFDWDFGDGETSTLENPTHLYATEGVYTVTLLVNDSLFCKIPDSTSFIVEVGSFAPGFVDPTGIICKNVPYQMSASGGTFYTWFPAEFLDDASIPNPTANVEVTTNFSVIIGDACGSDTFDLVLEVFLDDIECSEDESICIGTGVQISVTGSVSQIWTPNTQINDNTFAQPIVTPQSSTNYIVEATTQNSCVFIDTVYIEVITSVPQPQIDDTVVMCNGENVDLVAAGGSTYLWYPDLFLSSTTNDTVNSFTPSSLTYYCDFMNACGTVTDSIHVVVIVPELKAYGDTIICYGDSANLYAEGLENYFWLPTKTVDYYDSSHINVSPSSNTAYIVSGYDRFGCLDRDTVYVNLFPINHVELGTHIFAQYNDHIQLEAQTTIDGTFLWSPNTNISCLTCYNPIVNPDQNIQYQVEFIDLNGCKTTDVIEIIYDGLIYIPNTFTPDDNKFNPLFGVVGAGVKNFHMTIFDRWGEIICEINSLEGFWDGTYKGQLCQDGTYTWKISYEDYKGNNVNKTGHVNLLR